jgi:hypothetical protein
MRPTLIFAALGCVLCCSHCAGPAAAAEVSGELVCTVQDAIRWRSPRWPAELCEQVALASGATVEPDLMVAVAVLESQMRPRAIRWVRFGGRDTVACDRLDRRARHGCLTSTKATELWRSGARPRPGDIADGGLCGVRCIVGRDGRCANGPAKDLTPDELLEAAVNVRVAGQIMDAKRRWFGSHYVGAYNADPDEVGTYADSVRAVRRAIAGRDAKARSARAAELARKIREAVRRERTS